MPASMGDSDLGQQLWQEREGWLLERGCRRNAPCEWKRSRVPARHSSTPEPNRSYGHLTLALKTAY